MFMLNNKSYLKKCNQLLIVAICTFCLTILVKNYSQTKVKFKAEQDYTSWNNTSWIEIKKQYESLSFSKEHSGLLCPFVPKLIKERIKVAGYPENFNMTSNESFIYTNSNYAQSPEGKWYPKNCQARHRLAIIIPYKDRVDNLKNFLTHMHPFLQRQELEYQIFVVEQSNDDLFNKGILMNGGFLEIMKLSKITNFRSLTKEALSKIPFDCVIFHDVDLLPEDDRIIYSCPYYRPRHLSVAIDKYKYKNLYSKLIGGALNFKISHFVRVNGYSNQYWGWGAEDDDMEVRLSKEKIGFERLNINIARYRMLWHKKRFKNPNRVKLLMNARYSNIYSTDGINNVKYNVSRLTQYKLFTHLEINVGEPPMYIQQLLYPDRFTTHTSHVSAVTVEMTSNQQNAEQSLN